MRRQMEQPTLPRPTLPEIYCQLEIKLDSLRSAIADGLPPHETTGLFAAVYSLLEALPLTTDEFRVTRKRLRDTVAYLHSGGRKASLEELKLLKNVLCQS